MSDESRSLCATQRYQSRLSGGQIEVKLHGTVNASAAQPQPFPSFGPMQARLITPHREAI